MKKWSWLVIVFVFLLTACGAKNAEGYETIVLKDIQQHVDKGAIVLDVREVEEFEEGHIIGAVNVPLSELQKGNRADLDSAEQYIVICRSGNRSKEASAILAGDGYDVVNVSEGMSSWTGEVE
ncbi:rhodanese-like domain-containing protein [Sporosarcina sp. FSL K6-1522]|uniref:rhodanese-like domain-containing protein n=1 Tax=Sporosarcina sp. FSL K6-1522 TaxID=2921554 RepID=UPI00315A39FB